MTQEFDDKEDVKSFGLLIDAIKKQIPMKPIIREAEDYFGYVKYVICPNCKEVEFGFKQPRFCDNCGQHIDWGEDK